MADTKKKPIKTLSDILRDKKLKDAKKAEAEAKKA